jgi:hypothetical protein
LPAAPCGWWSPTPNAELLELTLDAPVAARSLADFLGTEWAGVKMPVVVVNIENQHERPVTRACLQSRSAALHRRGREP